MKKSEKHVCDLTDFFVKIFGRTLFEKILFLNLFPYILEIIELKSVLDN